MDTETTPKCMHRVDEGDKQCAEPVYAMMTTSDGKDYTFCARHIPTVVPGPCRS